MSLLDDALRSSKSRLEEEQNRISGINSVALSRPQSYYQPGGTGYYQGAEGGAPSGAGYYQDGGAGGNTLGRTAGSSPTGQVGFTGDSAYNDIANSLTRAKADYDANLNAQRQQATQDYDWNKRDLDRQSGVDQYNMVNDFAGRGVLNSGLYARAEDDRTAGVARQSQAMAMALQNRLNGFNQDASNFASSQADALNRAKQDAIARQAAKIGSVF